MRYFYEYGWAYSVREMSSGYQITDYTFECGYEPAKTVNHINTSNINRFTDTSIEINKKTFNRILRENLSEDWKSDVRS